MEQNLSVTWIEETECHVTDYMGYNHPWVLDEKSRLGRTDTSQGRCMQKAIQSRDVTIDWGCDVADR